MPGLGAFALAGAIGGAGEAILENARKQREDALAELKRKQGLEDYERRRSDSLSDYEMQRRDGLADEERGIKRDQDRINRTAEAYRSSTFSGDQAEFVSAIMPHAERVGREIGVAPEIIVAQAAIESAWGRSAPGNNFFGIKSHGQGGGQVLPTSEVIDGKTVRIKDSFRKYDDIGQSVEDYGRFLRTNPRYRDMLTAGDVDSQIEALGRSGYATDPQYASKVSTIVGRVRQMNPQIWQALADPSTPADVRNDMRQSIGLGGSPGLSGETWVRQGDQEILMGRSGGRMVPYIGPDGQPVRRSVSADDEYGRYAQEEVAAGREPLSRIDYAQAKKGEGVVMRTPDGTELRVGGKGTKFTEGQSKDNVYATRAEGALKVLEPVSGALVSRRDVVLDAVPLGIGREAQGDDYQVAQQAGQEFLQAILRKDTGAAITSQEQDLYGKTFLPQPGDGEAVLATKQASRQRAIEAIKAGMSPAQIIAQERAIKEAERRTEGLSSTPSEPQAANFSNMTLEQLNQVDVMAIRDPKVLDEMERRYRELTGGKR